VDNASLVSFDIENGKEVIDALDRAGKPPKVALWAKLPEYADWRLVIASDRLQQTGSLYAYSQINSAIDQAGISPRKRPSILLRPMKRPFIEALRRTFSGAADVYGMRLGGQTYGDQYLEDAFVYRIQ
jgi:hypothetical protein